MKISPVPSPDGRLTQLADRLDCLTEEDLALLSGNTAATLEQWRKRSEGPAYYRAGRRVLYPRSAVAEWLETRLRERRALPLGAGL